MKEKFAFKIALFIWTILGSLLSIHFLNAQHLFSVSSNELSKETINQLKTEIAKSAIPALSLTKNNENKEVYTIPFSSEEKSKIIVLNEQTGHHVVITPVKESRNEFQLTPFFIEEMKQGLLGDAAQYLIMETNLSFSVQNITAIPTHNTAFIPKYFYGNKENPQEALPKERQIINIFKAKPKYIHAFPDDPEYQQYYAQLEEKMSYYVYMYKLPDGSLCIYDEHFNPCNEENDSKSDGSLQFNLSGTNTMTAQQRTATEYSLQLWGKQLSGKVPVDINVTFKPMEGSTIASSYFTQSFLNNQNNTYYCSSLWNQIAGYDASTTYDIRLEFNSNFQFYYGLDANAPGSTYDYVTVMLHEVTHGLGFADNLWYDNNSEYNGVYYYLNETGDVFSTDYPNIFTRQLYQGVSGPCITELNQTQRANLMVSNNLYAGKPGSKLLAANGGARVKMYAPNPYKSGSSLSHWDESVSFLNFMEWAYNVPLHTFNARKIGIMVDMGWLPAEGEGDCEAVKNLSVNYNGNCEAQITWTAPKAKTINLKPVAESAENEVINHSPFSSDDVVFTSLYADQERPAAVPKGDGSKDGWLMWCGDNYNAIGRNEAAEFAVFARFTASDLTSAGVTSGSKITKIAFVPNHVNYLYSLTLCIYQGGTSPTNPGILMYQQDVSQYLTEGMYNEITLTTPYNINTSQELWIGYSLQTFGGRPAGCDAGPRITGKGDIMYWNGWTNLYAASDNTINASWNIAAYINLGGTAESSYNIYRDGILIASNVKGTSYTDKGFSPTQQHTWMVKSICSGGGESFPATVTKEGCKVGIDEPAQNLSNTIVYPNPTNGELRVTSYELRIERVEIFDKYGRNVVAKFPSNLLERGQSQVDGVILNISHLPTGIYFVRIQTETDIVTKKVIKY